MPNWCSTDYTLHVQNEDMAVKIEKILDYFLQNPVFRYLSGFGVTWLGNIIEFFGLPIDDNEFPTSCRGSIEYYDRSGAELTLYTETAWCVMPDAILLFRLLGEIEVGYQAEEPGCCLYMNDGAVYSDEWYYDYEDADERYYSSAEMKDILLDLFKKEGIDYDADKPLKELVSHYRENTKREDYYSIESFDVENVEDLASFSLDKVRNRIKEKPIPVYMIEYAKDGASYSTVFGVSSDQRLNEMLVGLAKDGYSVTSMTQQPKGSTAYELWSKSALDIVKAMTA